MEIAIVRRRRHALIRGAVYGLLFGLIVLTTGATPGRGDGAYESLGTFSEVLGLVRSRYVEEVNDRELFDGAFYGLTASLDPAADFIPRERMVEFRRHLERHDAGVGLVLSRRWGYAVVAAVEPGSPAARAGLVGGEILENIGTLETRGRALWEARAALQGPSGSSVALRLVRPGGDGRETIELVRSDAGGATAQKTMSGQQPVFTAPRIDAAVVRELERFLADRPSSWVLDLRSAGGDDLDAATAMAAPLLGADKSVAREVGRGGEVRSWRTPATAKTHDFKLAVLVDSGTRDAAEVLVGCLKAHGRARVVGRPTAGMAGRRRLVALASGGGVYLTVARFRPGDAEEAIGLAGVAPDEIVFERFEEEGESTGKDESLERAVQWLEAPPKTS